MSFLFEPSEIPTLLRFEEMTLSEMDKIELLKFLPFFAGISKFFIATRRSALSNESSSTVASLLLLRLIGVCGDTLGRGCWKSCIHLHIILLHHL